MKASIIGFLLLALLAASASSPRTVAAASQVVDRLNYSASTTGAALSGAYTKTNVDNAISYNISFSLKDTGNDGQPVYAKWRYQVLTSGPDGIRWTTTAAKTFFNRNGYGATVTGSSRLSQQALDDIAFAAGSWVPAVKLRLQVQVCRDAPTDNCSAYEWATWTTYPSRAFAPSFNCNGTTMVVDLRGIESFIDSDYLLNGQSLLVVEPILMISADWTFGNATRQALPAWLVHYPMPISSSISNVYVASDPTTPHQGSFSVTMTPGYYYAMFFRVWITANNASSDADEFPTTTAATYTIMQNGQGYYGDWRCVAV